MIKVVQPYYRLTPLEHVDAARNCAEEAGCEFVGVPNNNTARALNGAVKDSGFDCTYLFTDLDIRYSPEQVERLYSHRLPIVSGAYEKELDIKKQSDNNDVFVGGRWFDGIGTGWLPNTVRGMQKVDWCGSGMLMVSGSVFWGLPMPWFRYTIMHGLNDFVSHDIGFCLHCKDHGYKLYLDCDCRVDHIDL
jgi:hypothetical protein